MPLFIICFSSCNRLHEAQHVVAEADNFHSAGKIYDDSIALADAVATLHNYRLLHPNDYAKANYYYGKLLRSKENYVAAMQCFIDASHSHSTNHNILGRVYSNMGSMCHLADEFQLSYEMFEQCANQFKKANNSTAYYYALNDMAFQLAEQKRSGEAQALLITISQESQDTSVLAKTWETQSVAYIKATKYDSAIYSVNMLHQYGNYDATGYVVKAQAFWHLNQYDSALYYANYVMNLPYSSSRDKFNMLYILAYNDSTIEKERVQQITEERSDIDSEILDPVKRQLTIAVGLLKQSFNKKNYVNVLLLIIFCVISIITIYIVSRINSANKSLLSDIAIKQQELVTRTKKELQKQTDIQQKYNTHKAFIIKEINNTCKAIRHSNNWMIEINWNNYDELCEFINKHFFLLADKLKAIDKLDEKEIRLCILILLDMYNNKELADILTYSKSGIGTFKYRVSKKLNIHTKELRNYLIELIIS